MKNNPGHSGIVDEACQTLGKLSWGNADHQNKILAEGGIEAIVAGDDRLMMIVMSQNLLGFSSV